MTWIDVGGNRLWSGSIQEWLNLGCDKLRNGWADEWIEEEDEEEEEGEVRRVSWRCARTRTPQFGLGAVSFGKHSFSNR